MRKVRALFWKTSALKDMSRDEWRLLCDRCGICCLHKREDADRGEIALIGVACEFLDLETCCCMVYDDRTDLKSDCIVLSPENVRKIQWLPSTCAYRRVSEGRGLPWWHRLISGDPDTVHEAGISVRDRVVSGKHVHSDDVE